jgi:hypothetical protein
MEQYLEDGEFDEEVLELQKQLKEVQMERFFADKWNCEMEKKLSEVKLKSTHEMEKAKLMNAHAGSEINTLQVFSDVSKK